MPALSLVARVAVLGAVAATIGLVMLGNERSVGFGSVREGQSVDVPSMELGLSQRLSRLRTTLGIEPAQEPAWSLFSSRMLDLDQVSRRFEAETRRQGAGAADERAQHALLFAVALSDMDGALSTAQSAALHREARALGSTFICAEIRREGS